VCAPSDPCTIEYGPVMWEVVSVEEVEEEVEVLGRFLNLAHFMDRACVIRRTESMVHS
jgi:hypothetical protein